MNRLLAGAAGLATLAASSATAMMGIPDWDRRLFHRINRLPGVLAPIVWIPMQAGALGAPLAVGAWVGVASARPRDGARIAIAGAAAWASAKAIKRSVRRGRPGDNEAGTVLRLGSAAHGLGYPSGHAAVVVTMLMVAVPSASRVGPVTAAALAAVVGAGRIYVGAHYPLDVAGGWALGAVLGAAAGRISQQTRVAVAQPPERRYVIAQRAARPGRTCTPAPR